MTSIPGASASSPELAVAEELMGKSTCRPVVSCLVKKVEAAVRTPCEECRKHPFALDLSQSSLEHNASLLRRAGFCYNTLIKGLPKTAFSPGSEFRHIRLIRDIFSDHPDWKYMEEIITQGGPYHMATSDTDSKDAKHMIKRGNHKSSKRQDHAEFIKANYLKEVKAGWMIPLPVAMVPRIKGAMVIPIGCVRQLTVGEKNKTRVKYRVTHDASFPQLSGVSTNDLCDVDILPECKYGFCLIRILHGIHSMRLKFPAARIVIAKYDFDAAYRRVHVHPDMAVKTITIVEGVAYLLNRVPFGVKPGSFLFSGISEPIFDLTTKLLQDPSWDPTELNNETLQEHFSPLDPSTARPSAYKPRPLLVSMPSREAFADGFIDDIMSIGLAAHALRIQNAAPLASHAVFRPPGGSGHVVRNNVSSIKKLAAEGCPETSKTVLGWLIDTQSFTIRLGERKMRCWCKEIETLLQVGAVETKPLESLIGKLTNASYIIPLSRYFLNRLRWLQKRCVRWGRQSLPLPVRADLSLWTSLLSGLSRQGVRIDHVTNSCFDVLCFSDACELGLGGFLTTGEGWRISLPRDLVGTFSLNALEFIAAVVTVRLAISRTPGARVLAVTDSTSALGWLFKASFHPGKQGCLDQVARSLATIVLAAGSSLSGHHIKGSSNVLADSLSRDFHVPSYIVELTFTELFHPQVLSSPFRLAGPSFDVISWMRSLEPSATVKEVLPHRHKRSCLGTCLNGKSSWRASALKISGLMRSPNKSSPSWSEDLSRLFAEISSARKHNRDYYTRQLRERLARSGLSFART